MAEEQVANTNTVSDLESYQKFALEQQAQNNAWSAAQAQKQMDFQERLSNTAHQREVADLKAAGLNPILSVNSGASVPNGASGDTDTSASANVGAILQQVLQAQSAREVAAMYNAATINAASIAANASMYGADMSYKNAEDHPNSVDAVNARALVQSNKRLQQGYQYLASGQFSRDLREVLNGSLGTVVQVMANSERGRLFRNKLASMPDSVKKVYFKVLRLRYNKGPQRSIIDRFFRLTGLDSFGRSLGL